MMTYSSDAVDYGVLRTLLAVSLALAALSGSAVGIAMSSLLLGTSVFTGLASVILIVWIAMFAIVSASGAKTIG